jgi:hypothetical protein
MNIAAAKGEASTDSRADLEAERSAAAAPRRREQFRIPRRADTEPHHLPEDDGCNDC